MSIQKRTVFYDYTDGYVRFWDWADVETTLGRMQEPFIVNLRHVQDTNFSDYDPEDEITRVDEVRALPRDKEVRYFSSDEGYFMGGTHLPRVGP